MSTQKLRLILRQMPLAAVALLSFLALAYFPRLAIYRTHRRLFVAIALSAACLVVLRGRRSLPNWLGSIIMRPSATAFGFSVFAVGTLFFSWLSFFLFQGTPVLDDDISALFQARILLSGHLTVPAPQPQEFFSQFAIISGYHNVDWLCSMYPIGHAIVLLPGLALGIPWITMPLFAAGTCVLAAAIGRLLFDERTARLAAITCLTSPMFAELGATYLNHAVTAFGVLLTIWSVLKCLDFQNTGDKPRLYEGIFAGVGISLAFLCRPADAFATGIVIGIAAAANPVKAWKARGPLALATAILAVAVLMHLAWTQVQTGDWRIPGHAFCMQGLGTYGLSDSFPLKKAIYHGQLRTMDFGAKATGWPISVYFSALIPLAYRRLRAQSVWLWLFFAALWTLYFFYFWYEHCFPARYLFVAAPLLILLSSAGWRLVADEVGISLSRAVFAPALLGVLLYLPLHLRAFDDHWYDVERNLPKVVAKANLHNAVLIYDEVEYSRDRDSMDNRYYASAFIQNALDFNGDIIYVHNRRSENAKLPRLFPGREIYLYRFRRSKNLVELYREEFDPETGEPHHTFFEMDLPRYLNPNLVNPSIPTAPRVNISDKGATVTQ